MFWIELADTWITVRYGKCPKISNTIYSILYLPLSILCSSFLKYLVEWQTGSSLIWVHIVFIILSETLMYKILGDLPNWL